MKESLSSSAPRSGDVEDEDEGDCLLSTRPRRAMSAVFLALSKPEERLGCEERGPLLMRWYREDAAYEVCVERFLQRDNEFLTVVRLRSRK